MSTLPPFAQQEAELAHWRQHLHSHPELGFQEHQTAAFVARKLCDWGLQVDCGLAGTGVVGTLHGTAGAGRTIGLRADLDALPISERNSFAHASTHAGCMHACGHDGHTVMLLAAARALARRPAFRGTVHFIFQPAEEGLGGAQRMLDEGLLQRYPCASVYGLHNWPDLPFGAIGMRVGPTMAAMDALEVTVHGRGGHGALPHLAIDPVVVAAHVTTALQTIVSRRIDPVEAAVISVTCIQAGTAPNVIPDTVHMRGTVRSLTTAVRAQLIESVQRITTAVAEGLGASATVRIERLTPALVNAARETELAAAAAAAVVGQSQVRTDMPPVMGSEDFACLAAHAPAAYVFLGQGRPEGSPSIHSPDYDFDDRLLPIGAAYWQELVHRELGCRTTITSSADR